MPPGDAPVPFPRPKTRGAQTEGLKARHITAWGEAPDLERTQSTSSAVSAAQNASGLSRPFRPPGNFGTRDLGLRSRCSLQPRLQHCRPSALAVASGPPMARDRLFRADEATVTAKFGALNVALARVALALLSRTARNQEQHLSSPRSQSETSHHRSLSAFSIVLRRKTNHLNKTPPMK